MDHHPLASPEYPPANAYIAQGPHSGSTNNSPVQYYDVGQLPLTVETPSDAHATPAPSTAAAGAASRGGAAPPTVPAACLACAIRVEKRGKHLKCDGLTPCGRCKSSNSECYYVASRRGYKGPRRNTTANPNKRHASDTESPPSATGDSCPMLMGAAVPTPVPNLTPFNPTLALAEAPISPFTTSPAMPDGLTSLQLYRNPYLNGVNGAVLEPTALTARAPQSIPDRCLDSYYFHFFPGHPTVLPKEHLLRAAKERKLDHLFAAMRWAGSLYVEVGPARATFFEEAMRLCYAPDVVKDGFLVQAMVILLIGLDGSCQQDKAREVLADVERIAMEIGLYQRAYATVHGEGNPRLEESWRRTWWDLFVVDGMVAGVHQQTNFLLFDIVSDAALPCEEHQYLSGTIPRPMYLEDFDDQIFSGEDREFSSFAYRIAAIRNLGRMMRLPDSIFPGDDSVGRIETHLSNWRLHLPPSKRDSLTKECQLDEMMFQAHMIIHACSIMLHQPHSQLDSSPTRDVTACAPHKMVQGGENFNTHTRHILTAACEISRMVTYAVPITSHTHFFTCVLTLSSIVHLSKWALYFIQDDDDLRQQIRLNIGALNKLSNIWRAANTASTQVRGVAQEIYRTKKIQQNTPSFWAGFSQEEIMSSMAADEGIMSEINTTL